MGGNVITRPPRIICTGFLGSFLFPDSELTVGDDVVNVEVVNIKFSDTSVLTIGCSVFIGVADIEGAAASTEDKIDSEISGAGSTKPLCNNACNKRKY